MVNSYILKRNSKRETRLKVEIDFSSSILLLRTMIKKMYKVDKGAHCQKLYFPRKTMGGKGICGTL